ncbi:MAG TPA: alpha/beta hydrolase [Blastocatellia bacterium]|nr:alpha/beta hydrolase [Blastocatellia bacterium]
METPVIPGHIVSVHDIEMYYETCGDGEPLLLLHGGGGIGANWNLIFPAPPPRYRLIIPDLRGHGRSTNPSGQFTLRQVALDVFALLDLLGIERCKAIGLSLGAKALLHLATQQPGRIKAMVLVSATPYFPPEARAAMAALTAEDKSEAEWNQMRQWHQRGDEQILALWRNMHALKDSYDDMNFTPPYLSTITARTLIVHGDRDPLYPVRVALEMYEAIPQASLWVIPNGGHGPIFAEHIGAGETTKHFAEVALAFLGAETN